MQKTIKTMSSVVILSMALTSTSSAYGVIIKEGVKECAKKGCVQKTVKAVKELFEKGKNHAKENPGSTAFGIYHAGSGMAHAKDYFDDEEEITTVDNESSRELDLLKMED